MLYEFKNGSFIKIINNNPEDTFRGKRAKIIMQDDDNISKELIDEVLTPLEIYEVNNMIEEDYQKQMLSLHNIIKDGNEYKLQNNYYIDGDHILPVIPFKNRDNHNCDICSHFHCMGTDGCCDIYNKLLNMPEHHFEWASNVINCAAYNKIEKMNIIESLDDMITFIEKTENFFGSPESYEQYYGFERNWNEETGEILETVREYYERGGSFENIPTKYPCVIRFDWNCEDDLEWIYIGQ